MDNGTVTIIGVVVILLFCMVGLYFTAVNPIIEDRGKKKAEAAKRKANTPIVGQTYRLGKQKEVEFILESFDEESGNTAGYLVVHIPTSDIIRDEDTSNLENIWVKVIHKDGSHETLVFNMYDDSLPGLEGWHHQIRTTLVKND